MNYRVYRAVVSCLASLLIAISVVRIVIKDGSVYDCLTIAILAFCWWWAAWNRP